MTTEPIIRPADFADADAIATLHWHARKAAMPWLPRVHTAFELRDYIARTLLRTQDVFVAELHGKPVAYAAWKLERDAPFGWLNHLYVAPAKQHRGIGTALFALATKRMRPGFHLWVFQRNALARAFYEKHGCTLLRETDGTENEEREPDAEYVWQPVGREVEAAR